MRVAGEGEARQLGLSSLEKAYFTSVCKYLTEECEEYRATLFSLVSSNRTSSNRHRLKYRKFQLNIRKSFLIARRDQVARDLEGSPSVEIFKTALSNLLQLTLL